MATQTNNKSNKPKTATKPAAAPAAKPAAPAPVKAAPAPAKAAKAYQPTPEEIQVRAFEIYVSEGCREGNDLENWLRAERELRSGR